MKNVIMIHVSPHEIDQYQTFIYHLRRSLDIIPEQDRKDLLFIPYLNLSSYLYNWNKSWIQPEFFKNKFKVLNKIIEQKIEVGPQIVVSEGFSGKILGALSYKAEYIKKYKSQASTFIWFDCDVWFSEYLLITLIEAQNRILPGIKYVITPEIVRLWDTTWDIITNEQYLNREANHETYFSFDPFTLSDNTEQTPELVENTGGVKFASGWGNMLSSNLFDDISLEGLGHYGVDDTFIMNAMDILRSKGQNYKQYI